MATPECGAPCALDCIVHKNMSDQELKEFVAAFGVAAPADNGAGAGGGAAAKPDVPLATPGAAGGKPVDDDHDSDGTVEQKQKRRKLRGTVPDDEAVREALRRRQRWVTWQADKAGVARWIDTGSVVVEKGAAPRSRLDLYVTLGEVQCTFCGGSFSVGASTGNLNQHATSQKHKEAERKIEAGTTRGGGIQSFMMPRPRAISAAVAAQRDKIAQEVRALGHAVLVGAGTNPNQIVEILGPKSLVAAAEKALSATTYRIGSSGGTVNTDLKAAEGIVNSQICKVLKGQFMAIAQDGSSFRRDKVIAIVALCASAGSPFLLDLIFPADIWDFSDDPVYNFDNAAADIMQAVENFGIDANNITGFMADNASQMDAIAGALHLARLKCGVHAIHLTALALKKLEGFDLVQDFGALIYQGGGTTKAMELEALGLPPRVYLMHANRFGSAIKAAVAMDKDFVALKTWALGSDLLADEAAGGGDEAAELIRRTRAERVLSAFREKTARVPLAIAIELFGTLPDLVETLSGEFDSVPPTCIRDINRLRAVFAAVEADPSCVVGPALAKCGVKVTKAEAKALADNVLEVVQIALQKFDHHMPPILRVLEYRFRYSPRAYPQLLPAVGLDRKQFIGCLETDYGPTIVYQYNEYYEEMKAKHDADAALAGDARICRSINSIKYWKDKETSWPQLSKVAMWHLNFPTSNIACERSFGQARVTEALWTRSAMTHDTVKREVKFKYNLALMQDMLANKIKELNAFVA